MANDPVQRIREFEHETPLATDLKAILRRLADLPPSTEAPYLTVSLDWRPEGTEPGRTPPPEPKRSQRHAAEVAAGTPWRPSWERVQRELNDLVDSYPAHTAASESLSADVERLATYIAEELDPAARGVVVVACHKQGVFAPVPLGAPVATHIAVGSVPSLRQLVSTAEDLPGYAVLVADQRDAFLWVMARQTWERSVQLDASDYPRKQQQGGWSQRRYQARADERVEAFAKTIAEEARRELGEGDMGIPYLILAADEPMATAIGAELHESIKDRLIARIHLSVDDDPTQVAAATESLVAAEERRREQEAVQAVRDGVGARARGVAGAEDTLTALQAGQVMTLVINDDFSSAGWADYTLPLYGDGGIPDEHPAGGDMGNIVPVALADELLRLAIQQDAEIEIVRTAVPVGAEDEVEIRDEGDPMPRTQPARELDALGGVGAVLRFALDTDQPTAEL